MAMTLSGGVRQLLADQAEGPAQERRSAQVQLLRRLLGGCLELALLGCRDCNANQAGDERQPGLLVGC